MVSKNFLAALKNTLGFEGAYGADKSDPGGETFCGISRVHWPDWVGWPIIDAWKTCVMVGPVPDLTSYVRDFYSTNFWNVLQCEKIAIYSMNIACELFDTAVNISKYKAIKILQTSLNMQGFDLVLDGVVGPDTLNTLNNYLTTEPKGINGQILLKCMNGEQYIFYKNNPRHSYFRGWFLRT